MPRRPRGSLSRAEILAAALALVDRDGVAALSMRALADELGAGPMSLYNHVDGKQALLDGIVEALSAEIADNVTQPPGTTSGADWARQLRAIASAFRTVGHAHPQALQLLATRPLHTPAWARPVEATLAALRGNGFDDQRAVTAYRTFWSLLVGYVLAEIRASGEQVLERQLAQLDPATYPHTSALAKPLATRARDHEFALGLEAVLAGIAATLAPAG
ncbi:MAG TPA: TetR/AcrR family transcriptional regulator C-terminal domain-containing protein [Actinomycetes bacterium]